MKQTCGYTGHVCNESVQFISRYRHENDYCINGHRISVRDSGEVKRGTPELFEKILLFELDRYAAYLKWRPGFCLSLGVEHLPVQPFTFPMEPVFV